MVAVPGETPETVPLDEPMPATAVLLLAHVPPPGVGEQAATAEPGHSVVGPHDKVGVGSTVIMALPLIVLVQPVIPLVATTV
jgi:hypothetical protein